MFTGFFLGVGLLSQYVNRLATSTTGATGFNSQVYSEVVASSRFSLSKGGHGWSFSPVVGWTPLGKKSPESGEKTRLGRISARFSYPVIGPVEVNLGPSLLYTWIHGSGGTVTMNNGTSTSNFSIPELSSASSVVAFEFGLSVERKRIRLDSEAWVTDLLSASRRAVNLAVTLNFRVF